MGLNLPGFKTRQDRKTLFLRNELFWFNTQRVAVIYWRWDPTARTETSVRNYYNSLSNNPESRSFRYFAAWAWNHADNSAKLPNCLCGLPTFPFNGYAGLFLLGGRGGGSGLGVKWTTYLHLLPRLRESGVPSLPPTRLHGVLRDYTSFK
jgi:hypothetical protein